MFRSNVAAAVRNAKIRFAIRGMNKSIGKNIRLLNHGGCAVYAVELYKLLELAGAKGMAFRVYNYPHNDEVNVSIVERENFTNAPSHHNNMQTWQRHGVNFFHVVLQWDGRLYDSNGSKPVKKATVFGAWYPLVAGEISLNSMRKLASVQANWNRTFSRKQIPSLKRIMGVFMEDCIPA